AVQQFFEALGLARPPKVEISDKEISFHGRTGETLQHRLVVQTAEKRPVYAHATSDQPWLVVGPTQFGGASATVPRSIGPVPYRPGEVLSARLTVTANGNQRFVVPVRLSVVAGLAATPPPLPVVPVEAIPLQPARSPGAIRAATPIMVPEVLPEPAIPIPIDRIEPRRASRDGERPRSSRRRSEEPRDRLPTWVHLIPAALLVLIVVGVILVDAFRSESSR